MAFLRSLFQTRSSDYEKNLLRGRGGGSAAGVDVTPETAMESATVYACVRVLSEGVAQLPVGLYQRLERGRQRMRDHPVDVLMGLQPNPEMTSFQLREMLMAHLLLRGKAYCEIEWGRGGFPVALWPLHPDKVRPKRLPGRGRRPLVYEVQLPDGTQTTLRAEQVLPLRGLTKDGLNPYSPIKLAEEEIGIDLASREYGARFWSNGARPSGVLKYPGTLGDEAYEKLSREWKESYGGLSNAHRTAILEEGLDYMAIGIKPEEAQFLETRKYTKNQICAMFRVPPHMVGDLERATFSNIEQQSLEFVMYSLAPWLVRIEQQAAVSLLLPDERVSLFLRFAVDGLLRGDTLSRYQAYHQSMQDGWMSPNEIREKEDMNPYEGGDVHYVPLNLVPVEGRDRKDEGGGMKDEGEEERTLTPALSQRARGQEQRSALEGLSEAEARRAAGGRQRLMGVHRPIFEDVIARVLRREVNDVLNRARRHFRDRSMTDFVGWVNEFYQDHREFVARQIRPITSAYMELVGDMAADEVGSERADSTLAFDNWVAAYVDAYAARHVARNAARVRKVLEAADGAEDDPVAALESEFESWPEARAATMASDESVRAGAAIAVAVWAGLNVQVMRWVAFGDSCPYCQGLSGRVVGVQEFFILAGDSFSPDGVDVALTPSRNVGHAPAHRGCDCGLIAG